ncbi:hypothetical protein OMP38_03075 [Cohnella ginsengisoli]|uniref:Uncharacterized protein n=1 Tax=Cohnella ginsengisoli TaxID=425004 RepID=A0A9X4KHV9_9BACL|nr:hypothetical protein [Cohnella ginsengisoli]MDG0789945.1 hypothetical protein [Cohnella ginsengisoli]
MFYEDDEYEFEPDSNYYSSEEFVDDYLSFKKKENSYKDIKGFF